MLTGYELKGLIMEENLCCCDKYQKIIMKKMPHSSERVLQNRKTAIFG